MKKLMLIAAVSFMMFAFKSDNATWNLDKAHAKLGFTITHMMVSEVEGWFKSFDAKITASKSDFSDAVAEMTADVNSINTENEMRDNDLKSEKYFDAAKYPTITFKSKTFTRVDEKNYKVTGDLTIHGVTKIVELNAFYNTTVNPYSKKNTAGFKITGTIKRSDFGVGPSGSAMVGDEVNLVANAEFIKSDVQ